MPGIFSFFPRRAIFAPNLPSLSHCETIAIIGIAGILFHKMPGRRIVAEELIMKCLADSLWQIH